MIVFTRHAQESMAERGILEYEVVETINFGDEVQAREGKYARLRVFTSGYDWKGRRYPHKRNHSRVCGGRRSGDSLDFDCSLRQMGGSDMKITYDAFADAAYFYLGEKKHPPETRRVDDDIYLDFDEHNRLVGVEVLAASERLDLPHLKPFMKRSDIDWGKLNQELERRKLAGEPVKTMVHHNKNRIEEVGDGYVKLRRESGKSVTVTWREIEEFNKQELRKKGKSAITRALRDIAQRLQLRS